MARNVIESNFWSSKMAAGSHFVKKKVAYFSEIVRNAIEIHFRSSKMGGGASQWPGCKPFGDIHSICLKSKYTNSSLNYVSQKNVIGQLYIFRQKCSGDIMVLASPHPPPPVDPDDVNTITRKIFHPSL